MSFIGKAVGKVVGGITGSTAAAEGAQSAANTQAQSARESNQLLYDIFQQQREDNEPWRDAGKTALGQLTAGTADGGDFNRGFTMADFQSDPGYAFRMQQGQDALESSAAARGSNLSGATLKALTQYGQNMGSQEYQNAYNRWNSDQTNRFNRLSSLAGVGQTANQANQAASSSYGQSAANNITGAGNAIGAGQIAAGNAQANTFGQLMNAGTSAAAMYLAFSDRRLKSNIRRIGTHTSGLPWYAYEIGGQQSEGVMADEVLAVNPSAVHAHPSGYLMVDYGAL
ncbi:tail fiber domain-containing protein [Kerstersia gyiorum]|uniref:tail fiber domain-containing protein n=1 Tax=Kerstersia gyiorum TaxID=206506 RepID=UPI0020A08C50|nr:tail fiber domain-containing protein [Kerstersia gyiorum]MCP1679410.1 hypothetical protein [Kerstersia gyiorum]MCP1823913.1 hypothetical protein [Kerstersia gyiorum]MCP1827354.1 hypothetical protein [Kerstersia gyiorum]MCW2448997.1 hypothetical protein [Kerstersia gyiorum]